MNIGEMVSIRDTYGKTLAALGRENQDIVALDADLSHSTMTHYFAKEFPERFIECGIAEQNMISIAAGLASAGKIPFASTFAVFAPGRSFDQMRISVAQSGMNVKIVSTHAGITVGEDGQSHQAIEDLALAAAIPNMLVFVPADAMETDQIIRTAAGICGPCYIRLTRPKSPVIFGADYRFVPGRAATVREGKDVTIIATGLMVAEAIAAADSLKGQGVSCRVINMSTFKPIDEEAITCAARETGAIVTAEEHLAHGGLGSEVAMVTGRNCPVPMEMIAMHRYAESGKEAELLQKYGLTAKDIEQAVKAVVKRK